jgi:hypothetical protein
VVTMLNLFRLALRLVWPALIRFIDTKAQRFIFISLNQHFDINERNVSRHLLIVTENYLQLFNNGFLYNVTMEHTKISVGLKEYGMS